MEDSGQGFMLPPEPCVFQKSPTYKLWYYMSVGGLLVQHQTQHPKIVGSNPTATLELCFDPVFTDTVEFLNEIGGMEGDQRTIFLNLLVSLARTGSTFPSPMTED